MEFDSAKIYGPSKGNTHHVQVIAENLDATKDHILEIEPFFTSDQEQELRIESICVAGGDAKVLPFFTLALESRPTIILKAGCSVSSGTTSRRSEP